MTRPILYREKRKTIPMLPRLLREIHIMSPFDMTLQNETFLQANDGDDDKILIFASRRHLSSLANTKNVFCDGTFYCAPQLFAQMYTIHGEVCGHSFPLLYSFLPNKSNETYQRLFEKVRDLLNLHNFHIRWEKVLTDFETAAQRAFATVFANVSLKGCNFHYGKALWRKIQALGLASVSIHFRIL